MDAFGNNFTDTDPAAEFLAREHDQLAGLEEDLNPITIPQQGTDELLPTQESPPQSGSFEMINNINHSEVNDNNFIGGAPESSFSTDFEATVLVNGTDSEPARFASPVPTVPRPETEKIKLWREQQKKYLEEKDKAEEKMQEEWRKAAKKELEEWYKHHEDVITKTKAMNRNAEKQFVAETDEIEPGTEWERVAKLCDFDPNSSKGSKDVSRMRSIIQQLKQNPPPTVFKK